MIAHKLRWINKKPCIIQLTCQNDDIFTGTFSISGANIPVIPVARNLGVLWDSRPSMKAHVNQICRASYMYAHQQHQCNLQDADQVGRRDIGARLRKQPVGLLQLVVVYGLLVSTLNKLQLTQNHAARVVTGARKYDRITHVLRELYWLPVSQHIISKQLTLTYHAVHGQATVYLCELAVRYRPGHALRSADDPMHSPGWATNSRQVWGSQFPPSPVPPGGMICLPVRGRRSQCTLSRGN